MGEQSLTEACARLKLSTEQVQEKIAALETSTKCCDPEQLTLTQLIQRIVRVHHRRVRQDLPALAMMAARLKEKFAATNPELVPMARLTAELHGEMFAHIGREEQIVFPFVARMEEEARTGYPEGEGAFHALHTPLARMQQDHDAASDILDELEQRTSLLTPAKNSCATRQAFFAGLREFQRDLRQHLYLEETILFPRALTLEGRLLAGRQA
jgi:regulator of cell morphogenesis and NO signaling